MIVNRLGQSLNDISKGVIDRCIYAGFRWEVIWGFDGKISEMYHCGLGILYAKVKTVGSI